MAQKSVKSCLVEILADHRLPRAGQREAIRLLKLPGLTWAKLERGRPAVDSDALLLAACRRVAQSPDADPVTRLDSIRQHVLTTEKAHDESAKR